MLGKQYDFCRIVNTMSNNKLCFSIQVPAQFAGHRVDQAASLLVPDLSRSRLRNCILEGELRINNQAVKPAHRLVGSEQLHLDLVIQDAVDDIPQEIALEVVYEDEQVLVINKPAGMVVHPAAGHNDGTLLNALLYHFEDVSLLPRAGIVHRLDKDTSGLLVVARTEKSRQSLIAQLQDKSMSRQYRAICHGHTDMSGDVDQPIGRHPVNRQKMAVVSSGKPAKTFYESIETFSHYSLLRLQLTTGRTHQIRVHMHAIGHPIVGDPVYGGGKKANHLPCVVGFLRQALHAIAIGFIHPESGQRVHFQVPMAADMSQLIEQLRLST